MVHWCIVCKKGGASGYFSFPKKNLKRKHWCDNVGLPEYYDKKTAKICFKHFPKGSIKTSGQRLILAPGKEERLYKNWM